MRKPDSIDWRCGILDLLEAAAMRQGAVEIRTGGRWRCVTVSDVPSVDKEDWLLTVSGECVPVAEIEASRPAE
ncbi:MAG: hypothetical protein ACQER6_00365 [Pseudomonadota bacterium]